MKQRPTLGCQPRLRTRCGWAAAEGQRPCGLAAHARRKSERNAQEPVLRVQPRSTVDVPHKKQVVKKPERSGFEGKGRSLRLRGPGSGRTDCQRSAAAGGHAPEAEDAVVLPNVANDVHHARLRRSTGHLAQDHATINRRVASPSTAHLTATSVLAPMTRSCSHHARACELLGRRTCLPASVS